MSKRHTIHCYTCGKTEKVTPRSFPEGWVKFDSPVVAIPNDDTLWHPAILVWCDICTEKYGLMKALKNLKKSRGELHRMEL